MSQPVMTRHERALLLHTSLRLEMRRREAEIVDAMEWLEVAALSERCGAVDIDEIGLAIANAQRIVDGFAQGDGEMPMSVYRAASVEGALVDEVGGLRVWIDGVRTWTIYDEQDHQETMMDLRNHVESRR